MFKKLLTFLCGIAPAGAMAAAATNIPVTDITSLPGVTSNTAAVTADNQILVTADEIVAVQNAGVGALILKNAGNALSVADDMRVFSVPTESQAGGVLFVGDNVANTFSVQTDGDIEIGGQLTVDANAQAAGNRTFNISNFSDAATFDVNIGANITADENGLIEPAVVNNGTFNVMGVNNFVSGAIETNGTLNISANAIDVGAVTVESGGATLAAINSMKIAQLVNESQDAVDINIKADGIQAGSIQNSGGAMNITVTGNSGGDVALSSSGNIENNGTQMTIDAANTSISVAGTMVNTGTMNIKNVENLTVLGGDATINPSFVNNGDLIIDVAGETNLAYGFGVNMEEGAWDNVFSLTTGSLNLGNGNTVDLFANELNDFDVVVNKSKFVTGNISNGTQNANANMYLAGLDLTVGDVINNATLVLNAQGTMNTVGTSTVYQNDGDLVVNSVVDSAEDGANTDTDLVASGSITVNETLTAHGEMDLSATKITVGNIVGLGGDLNVAASNATDGIVVVSGDVTNEVGTTNITGRQILIAGNVENTSGELKIDGSDVNGGPVHMGGLAVNGGNVYLDGMQGVDITQIQEDTDTFGTGTLVVSGGSLNIGPSTYSLSVSGPAPLNGYTVDIAGDLTVGSTAAVDAGDVNISAYGPQGFVLQAGTSLNVGGNVLSTDTSMVAGNSVARNITLASDIIDIAGDAYAIGAMNSLVFRGEDMGDLTNLTVDGDVMASNGGTVKIYGANVIVNSLSDSDPSDDADVGGAIYVYGASDPDTTTTKLSTTSGGISIKNGIVFDESSTATRGLILGGANEVVLETTTASQDISVSAGVDVAQNNSLTLNSAGDIALSGMVNAHGTLKLNAENSVQINDDVTVGTATDGGVLSVSANTINAADVTNYGFASFVADSGDITLGAIKNATATGALPNDLDYLLDIDASGAIYAKSIDVSGGVVDLTAETLTVDAGLDIIGGRVNIYVDETVDFGGVVSVAGVMNQGVNGTGMLNLSADADGVVFGANGLDVDGFNADSQNVTYNIDGDVNVDGDMFVGTDLSLATVTINAETFTNSDNGAYNFVNYGAFKLTSTDTVSFDDVQNLGAGAMVVSAAHGIDMAQVKNSSILNLDSGDAVINMASLDIAGGTINLKGTGLNIGSALTTAGMLYQNYTGALSDYDVNIDADNYVISAKNVSVAGIDQASGAMRISSSDVDVLGDINATDLTIAANPDDNWLDLLVQGNVSGGTKILGLEQMTVENGDYIFDPNSQLMAAILPYNVTPSMDSTTRNYWSTISLNNDNTLGKITNATGGEALIKIDGGQFVSGTKYNAGFTLDMGPVALADNQIGIVLRDAVDPGTAIWLLNATGGLSEFDPLEKIRNLNVMFCNDDGTKCFSYLDSLEDGGAYISVRDVNEDGDADSLYVVFDPRFGGPALIENTRLQPIVARQPDYTDGEYVAAGALDNLIDGQLIDTGFFNKTPIEVIPVIFDGTNIETMMTELYNRMEYYLETANGAPIARFSRLVQPREIEQIAGAIALNDHTSFRDFEDRMFDEFIWNRNRNLRKAWGDFDFGMFSQNVADKKRVYGNRFSIAGGFDWQESETLILGLTGRISHMSSDNSDKMDLSYLPGQIVNGRVSMDVADTNVGLGAYLMKTLGSGWARLYGNAFFDMHFLDVTRHQNFVDTIDGDGAAFALTSEWGLMHDWLNQYVVGNLYARVGYNFGFDVTEEASGQNYMDLESDGYFMLTPGYSLTAQKRIYPTAWFQIRPYATIGIEYDVLGAPNSAKYKFAAANVFSEYDIEIDPMWANIGGGFEFLSASGVQLGIDYRYQYNNDMQLHNFKISGLYRF